MGETSELTFFETASVSPVFSSIYCKLGLVGAHPLAGNIVPLPACDAWITMNPASRLSNRVLFRNLPGWRTSLAVKHVGRPQEALKNSSKIFLKTRFLWLNRKVTSMSLVVFA